MFGSILGLWDIQPLGSGLQTVSGVGSHSLVGHPIISVPTLPPKHTKSRTNCKLKVICLGLCPNSSTGNLTWSHTSWILGTVYNTAFLVTMPVPWSAVKQTDLGHSLHCVSCSMVAIPWCQNTGMSTEHQWQKNAWASDPYNSLNWETSFFFFFFPECEITSKARAQAAFRLQYKWLCEPVELLVS